MVVDEQNYLAEHPGSADQVASGTYASALDHFVRSGETADHAAFPLLRELRSALQAQLGVEIPIVSLRAYVVSLAQGHTANIGPAVKHGLTAIPKSKGRTNGSGNGVHPPHHAQPNRSMVSRV